MIDPTLTAEAGADIEAVSLTTVGTPAGLDVVVIMLSTLEVVASFAGNDKIEVLAAGREEFKSFAMEGATEIEGRRLVAFPARTLVGIAFAGIVENAMVVTT